MTLNSTRSHPLGLLLVALVLSLSACANQPAPKSDATSPKNNAAEEETRPQSSNPLVARWPDQFRVVIDFTKDMDTGGGRLKRQRCTYDLTFSRTDSGWTVESDYTIEVPPIPARDGDVNELYGAVRCALPNFTLDIDGKKLDVAPLAEYEAARRVFLDYYERKEGESGLGESVARMGSQELKGLDVDGLLTHLVPASWSLTVEVGASVDLQIEEHDHILEASMVRLKDGLVNEVNCRIFKSETVSLPGPELQASIDKIEARMEQDFGDFRIVDEIHNCLDPKIGLNRGAVGKKTIEGGTFTGEDALGRSRYVFELKSYKSL